MSETALHIQQPPFDAAELRRRLRSKVLEHDRSRPRNNQPGVGASDLGHPCLRYLAHKALGTPKRPQLSDPWPAMIGTGAHEGPLTWAFQNDPDWLVPKDSMEIGPGIRGTADLYHVPTGTVIDHKVLGADSMRVLKQRGPKEQYRTQVHTYGFGYQRAGRDVHNVAIAAWPRSGFSQDMHVWIEPYDINVVEGAFTRWYPLTEQAEQLRAHPEVLELLPRADGPCVWCPFRAPSGTPPIDGCQGVRS